MNLKINSETRIIVQGITGRHGAFHTQIMQKYGTKIVAGVTPEKGGQNLEGIPIYNTVKDALKNHKGENVEWSILFVPAQFAKNAALEAIQAGLNLVIITENIPVLDSIEFINEAKQKKLAVIGPNCPGIISPENCKIGIMPGHLFKKGDVGVVSRSGTLTYEIINQLTKNGMGQSTVIGIGGDPIVGTDFVDVLNFFQQDSETKKIVLIGEIGGDAEERAAEFIKKYVTKPVVAYIVGRTAPPGKVMGHAGAIISNREHAAETAEEKIKLLKNAGVKVANLPSEIVELIKNN